MFVAANHLQNQIAVVLTSVSFSVSRANEMAYIRVKLQEPVIGINFRELFIKRERKFYSS